MMLLGQLIANLKISAYQSNPVRTKLVEVLTNPSTSSGRTNISYFRNGNMTPRQRNNLCYCFNY